MYYKATKGSAYNQSPPLPLLPLLLLLLPLLPTGCRLHASQPPTAHPKRRRHHVPSNQIGLVRLLVLVPSDWATRDPSRLVRCSLYIGPGHVAACQVAACGWRDHTLVPLACTKNRCQARASATKPIPCRGSTHTHPFVSTRTPKPHGGRCTGGRPCALPFGTPRTRTISSRLKFS